MMSWNSTEGIDIHFTKMIYVYTVDDGTNSERFRITSAGNVGVGENSPDRLLHLKALLIVVEVY